MSKKKKLTGLLLSLTVAFVCAIFMMPQTVFGATGDTPPHTKDITDNQDGTYTISLDIVGESEKKPNNVNVIVIVDTSGSMTQQRMTAAKNAVNSLANQLYAYNTQSEPNTVEMALVRFATSSSVAQQPTNSATTFRNAVNDLGNSGNGGTNWESALQTANGVDFGDDDQTFAIFVSDGNPTFRTSQNGWNDWNYQYQQYGTGQEGATNVTRCYTTAVDDAQTLANRVTPANFFTIGAFGNVDRMEQLTDDAGSDSSTNYYSAQDTAALNQAIADILAKIEMAGFADAEIDDGTTNQVTTSSGDVAELLELVPNFKYYRSGGSYGTMQPWTDAPAAKVVNGEVVWDLSEEGVLENGVRYTVTFDCYPSQTTYDIIAQLKNGDMTYDEVKEQGLDKYIVDNGGGSYSLRTNTNAGIKWDDTRDDEGRQEASYTNPDPVATSADQLTIKKTWEGGNPPSVELPITVLMDDNEFHTANLSGPSWETSSYISVGIIKNGQALPGAEGHDFSFAELDDTQYRWELDAPTVRPMLINGGGDDHIPTMLIKVDADHPVPSGAQTYTIEGATYYVDEAASGLTATNHRRSNLNLTKIVTGEDAPEDATFPFTLRVNNSKAPASEPTDDPEHNSDYWVWFSIQDKSGNTVTDATVTGATPAGGGYYYAASGAAINVEMKADWNLRFTNLPSGTTYRFVEGDLADGFAFKSAELTAGEDSTFDGDQTTTGTIENVSTSYYVTYTNDYQLTDLEITKEWEDNDDQDGIRPSAEEFAQYLSLSPAVEGAEPTVVDNDDGTYTITYTDLPRFNNGQEVEYEVTESEIDGYTTEGSPAKDHGTITNTHEPETVNVKVVKEWNDSDDIGKIRPTSIQAQLKADGTASGNAVALNSGNSWTYTWEGLDKYKNGGTEIEYTADETAVPNGYKKEDVEKTVAEDGTITFTVTNTYNPTPVSVDPPVQKIIENNDDLYNNGAFTFTIEAVSPEDAPMPENTSITNSAQYELEDKEGFYEFGEITFTMPGTYTYKVTESGEVDGVENDPAAATGKTLTFEVADDGDGNLVVDPTTDEVELSFTNTYDASGEGKITVTKELVGAEWPAGKTLTFTLTGADGAPMPETKTATLSAEGDVTFGPIEYELEDAGKTYTYTISEDGFGDGWSGSGDVTATVEVTDNGDGTLDADVTYSPDAVITNTYSASGTATLTANKILEGRDWKDGETFTFELQDETGEAIDSKEVSEDNETASFTVEYGLDDVGTHTYTIAETGTLPNGVTPSADISATVVVSDNGDGTLDAAVTYEDGNTITNTYTPAPVKAHIDVSKTIDGYAKNEDPQYLDGEKTSADNTFEFTLYDKDGKQVGDPITITTEDGEGTASFADIEYTKAGTYTYTVKETKGDAAGITYSEKEYPVTVTVTDNTDEGKLEAEISYGEAEEGEEAPTSVEVENQFKMTSVDVELELTKTIDDQSNSAPDSTFEFTLYKDSVSDENKVDEKSIKTKDLTGSVKFDPLTFDKCGEYTYVVVEKDSGENGFTYDPEEHTYKIIVKENFEVAVLKVDEEASTLEVEIVNVYKAAATEATLKVKKEIEDTSGSAYETEFTFELSDNDGKKIDEVTVVGPNEGEFAPITYEKAGTYHYTIKETAGSAAGYQYDSKAYDVTVEVVDNEGQLEATVTYSTASGTSQTEMTIVNTYDPQDAKITLKAKKVIEDKTGGAKGKTFTFELVNANGKVIDTVTRTGGGTVTFEELTYSKVGTYEYTIREVAGKDKGYTYDTSEYPVSVEVTDPDKDGVLKAEITTEGEIVITNTYEAEPCVLALTANKELTGRSLKDGEFTFQLLDEDGELVAESTNDASGKIKFDDITFDAAGTYTYTVAEVAGNEDGMTYDANEYTITVKVTDEGEGVLVAKAQGDVTFQNVFKEEPPEPVPDTGDNSSVGTAMGVMLASLIGLIGSAFIGRRRREEM